MSLNEKVMKEKIVFRCIKVWITEKYNQRYTKSYAEFIKQKYFNAKEKS